MLVALPELGALAALAACGFLIALYYAYGYSLGAVMQLLAGMFRRLDIKIWHVGTVGFGFIGDAIDGLDSAIRRQIGVGIHATSSGWHYMLHWSAYTLEKLGSIIADITGDTYRALESLRRIVVPVLIAAAIAPLVRELAKLEALVRTLPRRAEVIVNKPISVVRTEITRVQRFAVAVPLPRIGRLERDAAALRARLGKLEKAAGVAGVGVLAGVLLGKLGLGWTRCSKVSRLGRHVCGLDERLLDSLLLGTTAIVGAVSLVQLAEAMLAIEDELVAGVTAGFRELHGVRS